MQNNLNLMPSKSSLLLLERGRERNQLLHYTSHSQLLETGNLEMLLSSISSQMKGVKTKRLRTSNYLRAIYLHNQEKSSDAKRQNLTPAIQKTPKIDLETFTRGSNPSKL